MSKEVFFETCLKINNCYDRPEKISILIFDMDDHSKIYKMILLDLSHRIHFVLRPQLVIKIDTYYKYFE